MLFNAFWKIFLMDIFFLLRKHRLYGIICSNIDITYQLIICQPLFMFHVLQHFLSIFPSQRSIQRTKWRKIDRREVLPHYCHGKIMNILAISIVAKRMHGLRWVAKLYVSFIISVLIQVFWKMKDWKISSLNVLFLYCNIGFLASLNFSSFLFG